MIAEDISPIFTTQHGTGFSTQAINQHSVIPFKNHPQLPTLLDILIRKHKHHVLLHTLFAPRLVTPFLQALFAHINQQQTGYYLRQSELVLLNDVMEAELAELLNNLNRTNIYLLLAIQTSQSLSALKKQLEKLIAHPRCRILILTNQGLDSDDCFVEMTLTKPSDTDIFSLLKQQKTELESFHHVVITDELLIEAYQLAERYLSTQDALDQALLLLDSSAARAAALEQEKLTSNTLLQVLSNWTAIPASHLPLNTFRADEFRHALQQRIIGQDAAISLVTQKLQQAYAHMQETSGPFSSFLFAGARYTGKKTLANVLAEQLFNRRDALYITTVSSTSTSLLDLKLQRRSDSQFLPLKQIIRDMPYAILLLENIEQAPSSLMSELIETLNTGTLHDLDGSHYHLNQSLLLLSTTLGADRLAQLSKPAITDETSSQVDLMQFIIQQQRQFRPESQHEYTTYEMAEELLESLTGLLPAALCQRACIIPFLPLSQDVIEQIIRLKLKVLSKQLESRFGIDLGYAPEVIRFLSSEALNKEKSGNIDSTIKKLYVSIEQTILDQENNPNRPTQLLLQLNETGQVLRCHWLPTTVRQHAT